MKEATTLAFTGDIGFDHYMQNKWEDENLIDPALLDVLTSSDHVIANVEGPLAGEDAVRVKAAEMRLMHTIDPRAAVVLEKIHADIWNLANNHIMDVGPDGLEMTLEEAKKRGVRTIGAEMDLERAKRPVILDEAGGIGLFGVGYQRGCKPAGPDKAGCLGKSLQRSGKSAAGASLSPTAEKNSRRFPPLTPGTATLRTLIWAPTSSSPTIRMCL